MIRNSCSVFSTCQVTSSQRNFIYLQSPLIKLFENSRLEFQITFCSRFFCKKFSEWVLENSANRLGERGFSNRWSFSSHWNPWREQTSLPSSTNLPTSPLFPRPPDSILPWQTFFFQKNRKRIKHYLWLFALGLRVGLQPLIKYISPSQKILTLNLNEIRE